MWAFFNSAGTYHVKLYKESKILNSQLNSGLYFPWSSGQNCVKYFPALQVDSFLVEAVSLSHLQKVVIGHDGEGYGAGMYLKMVTVKESQDSDKEWVFPLWNWLDTHLGLCETVCEIVTVGKFCKTDLPIFTYICLTTAHLDVYSILLLLKMWIFSLILVLWQSQIW